MPLNVKLYTDSKFDLDDSALSFVKEFVQEVRYESLRNNEKKAATVSIRYLTVLYNQYVEFAKLGRAKLAKHLRDTLKRLGYSVVRTKIAVVVRGIVLNIRKLKNIYIHNPIALGS